MFYFGFKILILNAVGFLRPFGSKRLALLAERQIRPNEGMR